MSGKSMNTLYQSIGNQIRQKRIEKHMTQKELSQGICSQAEISKIENGRNMPTIQLLEKIAKRLKISKSAALRRAIRLAAGLEPKAGEDQLSALEELQQSLDLAPEDLREWEENHRRLRRSSSRLRRGSSGRGCRCGRAA